MAALCDLISAGIIEKDSNGDVLWTWSYPSVSSDERDLLIQKCGLGNTSFQPIQYMYTHHNQKWYYLMLTELDGEPALPKVKSFTLILSTRDFNPEKYEKLCEILSQQYRRTGSPAVMLEAYMAVVTRGACSSEDNGKFSLKDFDNRQAYAKSQLRTVIQMLGVESILLYTALMLKKRVAVYFPPHNLNDLLLFTRSLPALVWHRQNWGVVYPYVSLSGDEVDNLKAMGHYVAGFTEAEIEGRSDLYDVFVNGSAGSITVASHAKDALAMGKLHKDVAMAMVQAAENSDNSDQDIIKEVAGKTKDIVNNLRSLASDDGLSLETLKERKMPPATENFLFNLAACEGLIKL